MVDSKKLISLYFSGLLNEEETGQLSQWLEEDTLHLEEFVQESFVQRCLYDHFTGHSIHQNICNQVLNTDLLDNRMSDTGLWEALLEAEKTSPTVEIPPGPEPAEMPRRIEYSNQRYLFFRRSSVIQLLVTTAALIILALFVMFSPGEVGTEVATLTDSIGAKWADASSPMDNGRRLTTGSTSHFLMKGIVKLEFDNNARIVIEAPAEFQILTRDQIHLALGRLYAAVPQEAMGFTVDTVSGKIIDLGTEFGVSAELNGNVNLHMIKGKTVLVTGRRFDKISQEVTEGMAKQIMAHDLQASDIELDQRQFVRDICSRNNFAWKGQSHLDLADIVGGGNGLRTGQLSKWINLLTGKEGTEYFRGEGDRVQGAGSRATDYRFHTAAHLPYVDGVFCPDGDQGPFTVSSAGHQWTDCPDTSGICFEDIYNGSEMKQRKAIYELTFNGDAYGTREHPAIALHANAGITFDLQAMREALPGIRISRFKAKCGITTGALGLTDKNKADFWVLVDGQKRFVSIGKEALAYPHEISVSLEETDRFLTLACTDGGADAGYDWGFFAEPRLEIDAAENE